MVPTLVEKCFTYLFINIFCKIKLLWTGEPMHAASKERNGAIHNCHLKSEVSIISYVQLVTQHYKLRTVRKAPLQSK